MTAARITPGEIAMVCARYDIGQVREVRRFRGGSRQSPKVLLATSAGSFILKRRARGADDPARVAMTHQIVLHLEAAGFPVARLVGTRDDNNSMLQHNGGVYELFEFASGRAYNPAVRADTASAGATLALCHATLRGLAPGWDASGMTYHDHPAVPGTLERLPEVLGDDSLRPVVAGLSRAYRQASTRTAPAVGAHNAHLTHADWHPGNLLYNEGDSRVVAVFDFDSARTCPAILDVANSALQFSNTRQGTSPDDWPSALHRGRLLAFWSGYVSAGGDPGGRELLPDLMVQALIAEIVGPIAATRTFGGLDPAAVLRMVGRKVEWILSGSDRIREDLSGR